MDTLVLYAILIAIAFILVTAIAGLLKFLLKFIFKNIRFLVCLGIAFALVAGLGLNLATNPVTTVNGETQKASKSTTDDPGDLLSQAINDFGGIYSAQAPFLAYKFEEEEEKVYAEDGTETVRIKIEYLPMGSAEIEYDPEHGKFRLLSPLSIPWLDKFSPDNLTETLTGTLTDIKDSASDALSQAADKLGK